MLCIVAGSLLLQASLVWLLFSLPSVFSQRLRWISTPGELTACQCCNTHFNWNYDKPRDVDLRGISWQHMGSNPQMDTLIMSKEGIVKSPDVFGIYRSRVEYVPNAGMSINKVLKEDAGQYKCTVVVSDGTLISNTATLKVISQPSGADVMLTAKFQDGQVLLTGSGPLDDVNVTSFVLKNGVHVGSTVSGPSHALCQMAVPLTDEEKRAQKPLNLTCCLEKPAYARQCACDCVSMCGSTIVDLSAGVKLGSGYVALIVICCCVVVVVIAVIVYVLSKRKNAMKSDQNHRNGTEDGFEVKRLNGQQSDAT